MGLLTALWNIIMTVYYFFRDLALGNRCLEPGCKCEFYSDFETYAALKRQCHDASYAARMLDAGVVGRPLACDVCKHSRESHERLEPRRLEPQYMPNGGVVYVEQHERRKRARRSNRFKQCGSKEERAPPKVQVQDFRVGDGNLVELDSQVLCQYVARFASDNEVFERNAEFRFKVGDGSIIRGIDDGVRGMRAGGHRRLVVPPELAYGVSAKVEGRTGETLEFDVNLLAAVQS